MRLEYERWCACRCGCRTVSWERICGPCALAAWKGDERHGEKVEVQT